MREVSCFIFAVAIHSLLFLWQGGILNLPNANPGEGLGDMLVNVNFMAEIPSFEPSGGGEEAKPKGFLSKMASLIKGERPSQNKAEQSIDTSKWMKTDQLSDKSFERKSGFAGIKEKAEALDISKGQSEEILQKPSVGNFETASPNLKENKFKIAKSDAPFPILKAKNQDALANVNAIPVVVGKTTSGSVKSLSGGPGNGPALQSKSFASTGFSDAKSNFGGMTKGSSTGSNGGLQVAMGGGSALSGGAGLGTTGSGNGSGGSGGGFGGGTGGGYGSGSSAGSSGKGGKTWGGTGTGSSELNPLSRRGFQEDSAPTGLKANSNDQSGFSISGALANRPIQQKVLPPYEIDARVALRFRVDWSGRVLDGIIIEISSGNPTFDQKVLAALKQWLFSRLPANKTNEVQEGLISFKFKGV
jgi:TonB family protein